MSCSCCCTKTLDFCEQDVCAEIDFDIQAQASGIHKLCTHYFGTRITISALLDAGDNIVFPLDLLNENFQYTVELYDPSGTKILIRKNDIDYDCFKFQTVVGIEINPLVEESV